MTDADMKERQKKKRKKKQNHERAGRSKDGTRQRRKERSMR